MGKEPNATDTPSDPDAVGESTESKDSGSGKQLPWWSQCLQFLLWAGAIMGIYAASAWFSLQAFIRSADTVAVPDVVGLAFEEAQALALGVGLRVVESYRRPSADAPEGQILEQNPQDGFPVRRGQSLSVVVSLGNPKIEAPSLAGMLLTEARQRLKENHLALGRVYRLSSNEAAENVVIAQEPPAGTALFRDSPVRLVVSRGPAPQFYRMPRLVGLPLPAAQEVLTRADLSAQVEYRRLPGKRGLVISQYPAGGVRFRRGDSLALRVAQ
ncbi:MAG: PASTA domain-containing protein [Acidobacteriota bacterium]|nr:MAG: PASTA domain-containing protein [Acidobacteriota bacterium]